MHPLQELLAPLRARAWLGPLAIALFCTYAYFIPGPGWNQNSRLALTRAMAEQGTVRIDAFHHTTGDKSLRDGHFYSDKAPGASLLALPAYETLYLSRRLLGGELPDVYLRPFDPVDDVADRDPDLEQRQPGDRVVYNLAHRLALYVCGVATGGLLTVVAVAMLFLLALRQRLSDADALIVAGTYGLATLAMPYAGAFYGHQLCADFLLLALGLIVLLPSERPTRAGPALIGACLGLAVLCEYPAAIPALALTLLAAWRFGTRGVAWVVAGGAPAALILAAYHTAAFGSPFATGYDFVYLDEFARGMEVRYGIHAPDPAVIVALLFGSYRGLFYISPILLLAAWGLAVQLADRRPEIPRVVLAVASAMVLFYVLLNGGYYMWDGGSAIGPRHLIPMLPFLAMGLAPAARAVPVAYRWLAVLSGIQLLLLATASPEAPRHGNPIWDFAIPKLLASDASRDVGATNLGLLLGLPGLASLLPLAAVWAVALQRRRPVRAE